VDERRGGQVGDERRERPVDRREQLEQDARNRDGASLREAIELVAGTRLRLQVNVSEELALEALGYRLEALLAR